MRVSTFDIFSKLLLEKNYTYLIPEDKELLLYDFYMIAHLNGLKAQGRFEPGAKNDAYGQTISSHTMSMGLKETTLMSFEDIKEQIIDHLQPELLEAALYALSCEIRHVLDNNSISDIENILGKNAADFFAHFEYQFKKIKNKKNISSSYNTVKDLIKNRNKEFNKKYNIKLRDKSSRNDDYKLSYKTVKKIIKDVNMSELDFVSMSEKCFNKLKWGSMYGGPKWGQIAKAYIDLYYAKGEFKKIVYIDNMYHQQHNTNTVFNKLQLYYKAPSGYAWVLDALNFKADVKDDWERIKRIRKITGPRIRNIDKMYIEMFKAAGEKTWQQYYIPIEDKKEPEKPEETSDIKADKLDLDKEKYIKLAKDGFKQFGKIYAGGDASKELVYVGKGSPRAGGISKVLGLSTSLLYMKGASTWSGGNIGNDSYSHYAIPKTEWEKLFGSSKEIFGEKESDKGPDKEKYIDLAKDGFKQFGKIYDSADASIELIYVGKGSNPSICAKLGISEHIAMKLTHEDIWEGGNNSMYSGNMSHYDYAIPKDEWEELFGKVPFEEKSDKKELDKEKYIKLAKEGFRKYGKMYTQGAGKQELIIVGTGDETNLLCDILGIGKHEVYYQSFGDATKWELSSGGKYRDTTYAIPKDVWEKLFGSSKEIFGKENESDKNEIDKEKYIKLAKEGFRKYGKIYDNNALKELVYIGGGDTDKPISKYLKIRNSDLYSFDAGDRWSTPNYGSEADMSYAITKEKWEELFGSSKEIFGEKESDKKEVPEEVPDESSFITKIKDNITPANKRYFIEMAKLSRKEITNLYPKYIYMGMGASGKENYIITRLGLSPTVAESGILNMVDGSPNSMSVTFPNNFGSDRHGKYALLTEQWEQIFGPIDKVIKRPRKPSANNTMSQYQKLANDGYKLFDKVNLVMSSYIMYVGESNSVDISVAINVLPPVVASGGYFILRNDKIIPIVNIMESEEEDSVFLHRTVWEKYFGPVSKLPNYNKNEDWYKVQI